MRTITVIGIFGQELTATARSAIAEATLVVGGRRHLEFVAELLPERVRTVELGSLRAGLAAVRDATGPVAVLASGDPGWFGIVRALTTLGQPLRVLPAPSSLSLLAAATGVPWDDVPTVSAHGRDPRAAINAAIALPAVAVLTGPGCTVHDLATALRGWDRRLTIGERLGAPDQRVVCCSASEAIGGQWREPNIVLVPDPERPAGPADSASAAGWALPEAAFEHRDAMITKSEVRALALARLAPGIGRMIWDVGAGSGCVAIECARLGAAAVAVEADPASCDRIRRNARRHAAAVMVIEGRAPAALTGLQAPDAAFVGGGGPPVVQALVELAVPRIVAAFAALDHAIAARAALRSGGYAVDGVQLAASRLAELPDGAVRLAALNPVTLLWGVLQMSDEGARP